MNIFRYAWQNILRNLSLSFSSVLVIWLLIFFVNILLFVLYASDRFIDHINDRIFITINLKPWYTDKQVRSQDLIAEIESSFTGSSVEYIPQDEGLKILWNRNPDLVSIVENRDENPLPNVMRISGIAVSQYQKLDTHITKYQDILQYDGSNASKKLLDYRSQYRQIEQAVKMMQGLKNFVYFLIALFLATVFLVVNVIIRNFIHHFQDEISIIELVWGNSVFIYGPFVLQGIFYTVMWVFVSLGFFGSLQFLIPFEKFPFWYKEFFEIFYQYFFEFYSVPQVLLAVSIGIVSALFASYRYMDSTIRGK